MARREAAPRRWWHWMVVVKRSPRTCTAAAVPSSRGGAAAQWHARAGARVECWGVGASMPALGFEVCRWPEWQVALVAGRVQFTHGLPHSPPYAAMWRSTPSRAWLSWRPGACQLGSWPVGGGTGCGALDTCPAPRSCRAAHEMELEPVRELGRWAGVYSLVERRVTTLSRLSARARPGVCRRRQHKRQRPRLADDVLVVAGAWCVDLGVRRWAALHRIAVCPTIVPIAHAYPPPRISSASVLAQGRYTRGKSMQGGERRRHR